MEQRVIPKKERWAELLQILKSKIKGGNDNGDMFGLWVDSIMNGCVLQSELLYWLRDNPDATAQDILRQWEIIRPERDEDFDYDSLPDDEDYEQ